MHGPSFLSSGARLGRLGDMELYLPEGAVKHFSVYKYLCSLFPSSHLGPKHTAEMG